MEGKGEEGRGGAPFNLSARGPNWLFGRHCMRLNYSKVVNEIMESWEFNSQHERT
jgi:hypothetical protein